MRHLVAIMLEVLGNQELQDKTHYISYPNTEFSSGDFVVVEHIGGAAEVRRQLKQFNFSLWVVRFRQYFKIRDT